MEENKVMQEIKSHIDEALEKQVGAVVGKEAAKAARETVEQMRAEKNIFGYDRTGLTDGEKKEFAHMTRDIAKGMFTPSTKANEELVSEVDSRGGFLLPSEVAAGIERIARSVGVAASQVTRWPMGSDQLEVPAYTGSALTGDYLGINSAGSITAVTFKNALLQAKKWQLAFAVGNDLLEDAPVELTNWLMALAGESLANMIDKQVFNNAGVGPFNSILQSSDVTTFTLATGKNTFEEYAVIDDSATAIGNVEESMLEGSGFYFSRTVWANLRTQKDTAGNYLLGWAGQASNGASRLLSSDPMSPAGPRPVGEIMGFPVYTVRHLPALSATAAATKFGVFGNLKAVGYGSRGEMRMEQYKSGSFGGKEIALADQSGLVMKHRHAVAITLPEALVVIKTAAS